MLWRVRIYGFIRRVCFVGSGEIRMSKETIRKWERYIEKMKKEINK